MLSSTLDSRERAFSFIDKIALCIIFYGMLRSI